jgi:hypothetical protein
MTHSEIVPGSRCDGKIKPRYRMTRYGPQRKLGWRCTACGLHFFRNPAGGFVSGLNLPTKGGAS